MKLNTGIKNKNISSQDLGIDLKSGREEELFKWFLACLLFGKPIQQEVAKMTYFELEKENIVSAEKILEAGWDKLVEILDRGHYVRYDFSTATKLLETSRELKERYGSLTNLLTCSKTRKALEAALQEFKGIGPVTTCIFLRDLKNCRRINRLSTYAVERRLTWSKPQATLSNLKKP